MTPGQRRVQLPPSEDLPPGPLRDLTIALHEIYASAGWPPVRRIAQGVSARDLRDVASYDTVHKMLTGATEPSWSKLECVVRVLAAWSTPARDEDAEVARFKELWDTLASGTPAPGRSRRTLVGSVFVLGGVTGETNHRDYEPAELQAFCKRLGSAVAAAGADLHVCSPFPESADLHVLLGYVEQQESGTIYLHRPHQTERPGARTLTEQMKQLGDLIGRDAMARIEQMLYPDPENQTDDAINQAWLLCQWKAAEMADVIVAVGGRTDKSANMLLHLAEMQHKPVVPFTFLGGAAELAYHRRAWEQVYPWVAKPTVLNDKNAVSEAMAIAEGMLLGRSRTGPRTGRPATVFVSRSRRDAAYAAHLDLYLTQAGHTVVLGDREIRPDRAVETAIDDAIRRCDIFVALWSRSYAASRYCFDELDLALRRLRADEAELWIINLDGSDVVPPGARDLPTLQARTPEEVTEIVRKLLAG
jgi:TIR domain